MPDGTKAGDTFFLDLDPVFVNVVRAFTIKNPASGDVVANVAAGPIPGGPTEPPFRLTFTMTAWAEANLNVCGTADLDVVISSTVVPGTPITVDAHDGDDTWSVTMTPLPGGVRPRVNPRRPPSSRAPIRATL